MKEQPKPVSLMARVAEIFMTMVRFFHLLLIFSPVIVTLPLRMFDSTKDWWIDLFVESVARAGVVWIKAFQYLSHRRDMIGEDVAKKFVKLREDAPQHSYKVTCDSFKR
jgi:aarF domain-containing kinase